MERVRESIKQVDQNTWLIGDLILPSSSGRSDASSWYDPTDTISYTFTKAPKPPPPAAPLLAHNPRIALVYEAGDSPALWYIVNSASS